MCPLLALLTLVAAGTGRAVDWAPDEAAACAARGRVWAVLVGSLRVRIVVEHRSCHRSWLTGSMQGEGEGV